MRRIFDLRRPPASVLFLVMAGLAGVAAWLSFGLINLAMANAGFLTRHGWRALAEGGLWQALGIGLRALVVVICYFGFKLIETELTLRYRAWSQGAPPGFPPGPAPSSAQRDDPDLD